MNEHRIDLHLPGQVLHLVDKKNTDLLKSPEQTELIILIGWVS